MNQNITHIKRLVFVLISLLPALNVHSQAPDWQWANSHGGTSLDWAYSIGTDSSGNIYATGVFQSPTIQFGTTTLTNAGSYDAFLVKYDPDGNVLWAKSFGGTGNDWAISLTIDAAGNAYITGYFSSASFAAGDTVLTAEGFNDGFIIKCKPDGSVIWAKDIGGTGSDVAGNVAIDASGNIYMAGGFNSPSLTLGTTTFTHSGITSDIYLVKYDLNGNVLWAKHAGGNHNDGANSVVVDASGNIYLGGAFHSAQITFGSTTLVNTADAPYGEMYVTKYDAMGNVLWAKSGAGLYGDFIFAMEADASGNIYLMGDYGSPELAWDSVTLVNPDPEGGASQLFVAKMNPEGEVLWLKGNGGSLNEYGMGIALDPAGNAYVSGTFESPSITFGPDTLNNAGTYDMFVAKYDPDGNEIWGKSAGGNADDMARAITIDANGKIFVAGSYDSTSMNFGAATLTNAGSTDIFLVQLDNNLGASQPNPAVLFSFYPNPVSDSARIIVSGAATIEIVNMTGQIVRAFTVNTLDNEIGLADLSAGVYIARVKTEQGTNTVKFIKS